MKSAAAFARRWCVIYLSFCRKCSLFCSLKFCIVIFEFACLMVQIIVCNHGRFSDTPFMGSFQLKCSWEMSKLNESAQMAANLLSCIIVSDQIVNSVCWSHALVNGPTSKMPASDGGLCIGQLLMMWSAVCSGWLRMNCIHSQSVFAWTLTEMSDTLICPLGK